MDPGEERGGMSQVPKSQARQEAAYSIGLTFGPGTHPKRQSLLSPFYKYRNRSSLLSQLQKKFTRSKGYGLVVGGRGHMAGVHTPWGLVLVPSKNCEEELGTETHTELRMLIWATEQGSIAKKIERRNSICEHLQCRAVVVKHLVWWRHFTVQRADFNV